MVASLPDIGDEEEGGGVPPGWGRSYSLRLLSVS